MKKEHAILLFITKAAHKPPFIPSESELQRIEQIAFPTECIDVSPDIVEELYRDILPTMPMTIIHASPSTRKIRLISITKDSFTLEWMDIRCRVIGCNRTIFTTTNHRDHGSAICLVHDFRLDLTRMQFIRSRDFVNLIEHLGNIRTKRVLDEDEPHESKRVASSSD